MISTIRDLLPMKYQGQRMEFYDPAMYLLDMRRTFSNYLDKQGKGEDLHVAVNLSSDTSSRTHLFEKRAASLLISEKESLRSDPENKWSTSIADWHTLDRSLTSVFINFESGDGEYEHKVTLGMGKGDFSEGTSPSRKHLTLLSKAQQNALAKDADVATKVITNVVREWTSDVRLMLSIVTGTSEPRVVLHRDPDLGLPIRLEVQILTEENALNVSQDSVAMMSLMTKRLLNIPASSTLSFLDICGK